MPNEYRHIRREFLATVREYTDYYSRQNHGYD